MSERKTHVAIVLDRSYSMGDRMEEAISGYNEQIKILKTKKETGEDIDVSLVTFDGEVYEHMWKESPSKLIEASPSDYKLGAWTAMRDAVGFTVKKLLDTTNPDDENVAYLVIVISDGETNKDKIFGDKNGVAALREMIQGVQRTNKWTFTYMGCSENYMEKIAKETAIPLANMASWSNVTKSAAANGMKNLSARTSKYFNTRSEGFSAVADYMSDDINKVASFNGDSTDAESLNAVGCTTNKAAFVGNITKIADVVQLNVEGPINWKYTVNRLAEIDPKNIFANACKVETSRIE